MHTYLDFALLSEGGGGFNPLDPASMGIVFWTWIIFLVSLPLIWKIVMGPVTRGLEARDEQAAKAIAAAEEAKRGAESARADVEAKLAEANRQAAAIVEEARQRAEAREREMLDKARQEAGALLDRARGEIRAEQDKAISAIRREVVDLSLHAAGQVLRRKVDAADDKRLVEELVASVKEGRP